MSDPANSFNGMIAQIQDYIGEMRKKEKLESELEIARQVQNRFFPRAVPELKTLELAGVCIPGRFVSGDYYDYLVLDSRSTAIAFCDVSGRAARRLCSWRAYSRRFTRSSSSGPAGRHRGFRQTR